MNISGDDEFRRQVMAHTVARHVRAPWSVEQQVAGLIGDGAIAGSAATYEPAEPTTWSVSVVTDDGRLIRFRAEYEVGQYDFDEEQSPFRRQTPVASTVHEAWVRRLRDAVRLDVRAVRTRLDAFRNPTKKEIDVGGVHLGFGDGFVVDLEVDQTKIYDPDERARSDAFLAAIRLHTGL